MSLFQEIDPTGLQALRESHETLLLVDVRTPQETALGVIPGARLVPLHELPDYSAALEGHGKLVFYCQAGGRSAQACEYMLARGTADVVNLRGGIMAWNAQGLELVNPAHNPAGHQPPPAR